jgi:hypothetical protein
LIGALVLAEKLELPWYDAESELEIDIGVQETDADPPLSDALPTSDPLL